jgi:hypothetical protein
MTTLGEEIRNPLVALSFRHCFDKEQYISFVRVDILGIV